MAFENTTPRKMNLNTVVKPKYRIFDILGSEDFTITACTFRLIRREDGVVVIDGDSVVNNTDENAAEEEIKTVQHELDLGATDFQLGQYWLSWRLSLSNGESDVMRQLVEIVDFEVVS